MTRSLNPLVYLGGSARSSSIGRLVGRLSRRIIRLVDRASVEAVALPAHDVQAELNRADRPLQRMHLDRLNEGTVGGDVYIVGGGPSLKDIDLSQLDDKAVIAVNYSIFTLPNAAFFVTLDPRFFAKVVDRLPEFNQHPATKILVHNWATDRVVVQPDRLTVGPTSADFSGFSLVIRSTVSKGFGKNFLDFRNGANSGYCAMQLALLLGYTRIHLLGFDLTGTHFHDAYKLDPNCLPDYIRYFRDGLQSLAAERPDVEVISHSPVSVLNDLIPFVPLAAPAASPATAG